MSATNVLKKIFCGVAVLGLWFGVLGTAVANTDCPSCRAKGSDAVYIDEDGEIIDKDGSIFPGGGCDRCAGRESSGQKVRIVDGPQKPRCPSCAVPVFETKNYEFQKPRYKSGALRECCDLASFHLAHVDFKLNGDESALPYSGHVGNYRFRIFGCRRMTKKAILNQGRVIQKDMAFFHVFRKAIDKCYKVMEIPGDVCLADESVKLPEYALTAEITNFFMNVCDEFDWDKAKKADKRNGTAEMTVTWRLMNLSETKVLWKGVTTGYAELEDGIFEGEVKLAEDAFADAVARLSSMPGFEAELENRVSAEEMAAERAALVEYDETVHPGKCEFKKEVEVTHSCDYAPQPQCPAVAQPMCPCAVQKPCVCTQPVCSCPQVACPCAAPQEPKVEEFVDVQTQTETTTVEKKIITTKTVETPAPVCKQVCVPVCPPQPKKMVTTTTTTTTTEETTETTVEEMAASAQGCPLQCSQKCETPKQKVVVEKTVVADKPVYRKPRCKKICTETCYEHGKRCSTECVKDCSEVVETKEEVQTIEPVVVPEPVVEPESAVVPEPVVEPESAVEEPEVFEAGGVEVKNVAIEPQITEAGGVTETHRVYENCIDEKGDVISDGSCTVIDDNWVDLEGFNVDSKLCIVDRPAYTELSPENMLKIRGSVVDIVNAKGVQGTGLIISDSFLLTSAGLVNKLQNTYDVKTINGEVLKAKAVRINPSKNIALLHLEKPVAYTPLALNLELPAIDQEGFISLSVLGNNGTSAKNYMDDNGKIYGYRYSDTLGTEIIVDTLVQKVTLGSVLIDRLGTVSGISNSAKQTAEGMDLFIPTETALRSVGLSICEKLYDKKSPWRKTVYKPVTEKVKQETKAPEAMTAGKRK